ncbi:DUF5715 family protein [Telmatobacter sp. DSM 110680]|uniref:DUF5715 family protein n=1 Tax=Telmatobacter sp. DSM 110680 TaxID=3036704 RepID=A0AAU7DRN4_9BACT
MARIAFTTLLLASLVAIPASATRIDTVQLHAHASITKSSVHRAHRTGHPTASHGTPRSLRSTPTSKHKSSASHTTTRQSAHYSSSPSRRVIPSSRYRATLKRSRYNRYRSSARFIPMAAVPAASTRSGTMEIPEPSAKSPESLPTETDAEAAPAPRSTPRPADSTPAANAAHAETDTAPAPGTDPATIAAAGNPLAAPRETRQPIVPASGQVAELMRPPIITGRVSSYTLRGTHDSLVRQNARSEEESLERIEDDADLQDRIARGLLVRVPESGALIVNAALPEDRRYCRPWTADFLTSIARAHQSQFHSPLVVSSAVRTVEYQKRLMRINGNAADAEGDVVSPHLTGATIDIAKSGLSKKEMLWMRNQLLAYQNAGVIDVEEEFHQRCFHITVYKNYSEKAQSHGPRKATPAPQTTETDATATLDPVPDSQ